MKKKNKIKKNTIKYLEINKKSHFFLSSLINICHCLNEIFAACFSILILSFRMCLCVPHLSFTRYRQYFSIFCCLFCTQHTYQNFHFSFSLFFFSFLFIFPLIHVQCISHKIYTTLVDYSGSHFEN